MIIRYPTIVLFWYDQLYSKKKNHKFNISLVFVKVFSLDSYSPWKWVSFYAIEHRPFMYENYQFWKAILFTYFSKRTSFSDFRKASFSCFFTRSWHKVIATYPIFCLLCIFGVIFGHMSQIKHLIMPSCSEVSSYIIKPKSESNLDQNWLF